MDELVGYSVKTFSPGSIGDSLKIGKHKFLILLISQNIKYLNNGQIFWSDR